ncbi:hypothetical protein TNCT_349251 [Trichonephila clavata]|uniref:Uncharacterized protein n=1 Tax=Trichonephila clavata TaxID=2740835 RepID=A0A8X6L0R3_TRICU|nr:hypothetical protein TNCT_349251 [Trichonephila clavata]
MKLEQSHSSKRTTIRFYPLTHESLKTINRVCETLMCKREKCNSLDQGHVFEGVCFGHRSGNIEMFVATFGSVVKSMVISLRSLRHRRDLGRRDGVHHDTGLGSTP